MASLLRFAAVAALFAGCSVAAEAKPIAFANGTTAMAEYGADTMIETQAFYAPSFRYSVGGGFLRIKRDLDDATRDIGYVRFNYLPKRWNMEDAQANVFIWGGVGGARASETDSTDIEYNVGGQLDYETRRVYASARTDFHDSRHFSHRIDTVQLGLAPYKHDFNSVALWFVVQARQYTGGIYEGTEWAGLIRVFKRSTWIEAGITQDRKIQAMLMFNF